MGDLVNLSNGIGILSSFAGSHTLPYAKKVRVKTSRPFNSLPSSPVKRKSTRSSDGILESFTPFDSSPVDTGDQILWWKVPDVQFKDFYDWQLRVHKVDDFTFDLCGVLKTSPYFARISVSHRQQMMKFFNAGAEVLDSIAEHFLARMNGHPKREKHIISLNAMEIGLFRYGKIMYAVENKCPHQGGPLATGDIEEINGRPCINCPWHHWRFDLLTGKSLQVNRADASSATVFPVRLVEGEISVGFQQYNPDIFENFDF